jgi:hypothetical protein
MKELGPEEAALDVDKKNMYSQISTTQRGSIEAVFTINAWNYAFDLQ